VCFWSPYEENSVGRPFFVGASGMPKRAAKREGKQTKRGKNACLGCESQGPPPGNFIIPSHLPFRQLNPSVMEVQNYERRLLSSPFLFCSFFRVSFGCLCRVMESRVHAPWLQGGREGKCRCRGNARRLEAYIRTHFDSAFV